MNSSLLAVFLIATCAAAWSAADFSGMADQPAEVALRRPGETLRPIASHGCTIGGQQRIELRVPRVRSAGLSGEDRARIERAVMDDWRREMAAAGIPNDLLDRATRMPSGVYLLSIHETDRLGCIGK
jgi:hypothetical protein